MLRLENAATGYGRIRVLDSLALELGEGRVLAVIGPNGAGKSTLMRAMCGSVPLWDGQVLYEGTDITRLSAEARSERGLILCPEGRRIFSSLSIEENLMLGATPLRGQLGRSFAGAVKDGLERAYSIFPILKERRQNSGGALSGGQQQMLAIARALMARPKLLLLDEPSLGLSPKMADDVYATLHLLKKQGLTIIVVEEAAGRPLALADDAIVMRNGCIVRRDSAEKLRQSGNLASAYLGVETA
ncbi:ABC transporter ATP-binding protein [Rhizobium sp. KVB221]|uniref:ABC transporter ATP-binding protein n=1 Tax=Rhizobium setariae TaxID=2801340 RepID=A0A936YSF3_9HYPH|nr:ABC transporter ATP-binding protein [Rhizobium setariae]MBL0373414.1 ABC transporter ATP-binding protein [Rhizobium setariae]